MLSRLTTRLSIQAYSIMLFTKLSIVVFSICFITRLLMYLPTLLIITHIELFKFSSLISSLTNIASWVLYIGMFILVYLLCKINDLRREYISVLLTSYVASLLGLILGAVTSVLCAYVFLPHHNINLINIFVSIGRIIIIQFVSYIFTALKYTFASFTAVTINYIREHTTI